MKILFVCTGNTCRSPMAQYLFTDILKKRPSANLDCVQVKSAGLYTLTGMPASAEAIQVMREEGVDLSLHRTAKLDWDMINAADMVLTMTIRQKTELAGIFPAEKDKIWTLGEIAGCGQAEVSDPYGQDLDEYRITVRQIKTLVQNVIERLAK